MTETERNLLYDLATVYNQFSSLSDKHPSDMEEVVFHIHALQRIVMARLAARSEPNFFTDLRRV